MSSLAQRKLSSQKRSVNSIRLIIDAGKEMLCECTVDQISTNRIA